MNSLILTLAIVLNIRPGDKIIWGDNSNCKGIVLSVNEKLLKVKGVCQVPLTEDSTIPVLVEDYISTDDVKGFTK